MKHFAEDPAYQRHARAWAESQYPGFGDEFVAFLAALDEDEQERVADRGYTAVRDDFEAACPETLA